MAEVPSAQHSERTSIFKESVPCNIFEISARIVQHLVLSGGARAQLGEVGL